MHNIYELLDVIFYRRIGLSIAEIKSLLQNHDKDSMQSFLRQREALVRQRSGSKTSCCRNSAGF
jgi:DNA-binding transcriptional MerR regulator